MNSVSAPIAPPSQTYRLHIDHPQVHLPSCAIMASKCISKLTPSQPAVRLETHSSIALKYFSILTQLWPPSLHHHAFQLHLQTRLITASEYISTFPRSWPPSVSPNTFIYCLPTHLHTWSIGTTENITQVTLSRCGRTQQADHQHSAGPYMPSEDTAWERQFLAGGENPEGGRIWRGTRPW